MNKIAEGHGTIDEPDQLHRIASAISSGNTICAFGDGAAQPVLSFVRKFRKQFEDYVLTGGKSQTKKLVA
ncbi:MAG: NADH-ubiquinone oxidoreductase-F iron-sulfur binding region domain-containing protein [Polyangiaceae bacterium]